LPRGKIVVFTGPSGSGKSSLAFDTIYAEGQRRYVESLSAYARQFLEQLAKPDVERIEGLSPAIAIEQRPLSKSPRSTVGTVTEIADYLRLLYARVGVPHCPSCGKRIEAQTVQQIVDRVLALTEGTRSPPRAHRRARKGELKLELERLRREGFVRARIDGSVVDLGDEIELDRSKSSTTSTWWSIASCSKRAQGAPDRQRGARAQARRGAAARASRGRKSRSG
jgi:excinuclease ABC subunit A